ncbi:hypothetical protein GCM10023188_38780 [Pontibacter saemangeumensis]|uniref:Uncharacterized protein n=1 Tax=Pontibacter saemangeumensis TaxID=1084525 RepID=A0ABP8M2X7_9BACT
MFEHWFGSGKRLQEEHTGLKLGLGGSRIKITPLFSILKGTGPIRLQTGAKLRQKTL